MASNMSQTVEEAVAEIEPQIEERCILGPPVMTVTEVKPVSEILVDHKFTRVNGAIDLLKRERIAKRPSKTLSYNTHDADIVIVDENGDLWMARGDSLPPALRKLVSQKKMHVPSPEINLNKLH